MKILSITLENINSLKGKFTLPLDDYLADAALVFAITGPTGSGKTSILDAICAAFYGRTPRLKTPADMDELMTHHTAQCLAEVTFSINQELYRSRYERHRAKKKITGRLQKPTMELVNAKTGNIITDKLSMVPKEVERITGLDFNRFCKSIMLAQGNFDAFLKADRNDRALLLEKITGTEIYAQISTQTFEKNKQEQEALVEIRNRLSEVKLLSAEEINQIKINIREYNNSIKEIHSEQERLVTSQTYFKTLQDCRKTESRCNADLEQLEKEEEQAQVDLQTLARAKKTTRFLNEYQALDQTLLMEENLTNKNEKFQHEIPAIQVRINDLLKKQAKVKPEFENLKKKTEQKQSIIRAIKEQLPLLRDKLKQTQKLQAESIAKEKQVSRLNEAFNKNEEELEIHSKMYTENQDRLNEVETQKEKLIREKTRLLANETLEDVESQHRELKDRLVQLKKQEELLIRLDQVNRSRKETLEKINRNKKDQHQYETQLDEIIHKFRSLKESLANLRRQRELELKIQDLEILRNELIENEPCPLCGSTDHPFQDKPPQKTRVALKIEQHEKELDDTVNTKETLEKRMTGIESDLNHLISQECKFEKEIQEIQQDQPTDSLKAVKSLILKTETEVKTAQEKHATIKSIFAHIYDIDQNMQTLQESLLKASQKVEKIKAGIDQWKIQADAADQDRSALASQLESVQNEIRQIYKHSKGFDQLSVLELSAVSSGPDQLEHSINGLGDKLSGTLTQHRNQIEAIEKELQLTRKELEDKTISQKDCIKELNKLIQKKESLTASFTETISKAGFQSLEHFKASLISPEQLSRLETLDSRLSKRRIELETRLKDNKTAMHDLLSTPPDHEKLHEIETAFEKAKLSLASANKKIAEYELQLSENTSRRSRYSELLESETAQIKECEKWSLLNDIIGQKDGAKFRLFAQDLTLTRLIFKANQYLGLFNNRYILEKNPDAELELMVTDTFFADRIRPMENLSGGETFLISLSLALGLSDITRGQTQIDSLFLDEGFGTLDKDTLEVALAAIDTLNASGKTVCIISHVESLKERIFLKIEVSPVSDGTSRIILPDTQPVSVV